MGVIGEMLKERRGEMPMEDFAHAMGLRISTYSRYESSNRNISVPTLNIMAKYFKNKNDIEMVTALATYALGFNPLEIITE